MHNHHASISYNILTRYIKLSRTINQLVWLI